MDEFGIAATVGAGIPSGQLELHVQPIVDLSDTTVVGGECFVRWHHPEHGTMPPGRWIPAAAAAGVLGRAVTTRLDDWIAAGHHVGTVSLNVDPAQLDDTAFCTAVTAAARRAPGKLAVEVHHRHLRLVESDDGLLQRLLAIRAAGIELWIDDLTRAEDLPSHRETRADRVKFDRSLLAATDSALAATVAAVQPLPIVIEGVETRADADRCHSLGIEFGQGFEFGPPTPLDTWLDIGTSG